MELTAHRLRFYCRAVSAINAPPYKGSLVRGALFAALRQEFCLAPWELECSAWPGRQGCPVCALLAPAGEGAGRGAQVTRPCTIEPPLEETTLYRPGDLLSFGVTLFGDAAALLPYVIMGVRRMGESGIGGRGRQPGRFRIARIETEHPLLGRRRAIWEEGQELVRILADPLTHADVLACCRLLGRPRQVTLHLLTPMRLVSAGRLVRRLTFPVFLRRLLRRLTDLSLTATGLPPAFDHRLLLRLAEGVRVASDQTRWRDVRSYSTRQGRYTPIGGLVGEITFAGELSPFLPWLLWGEVAHVGRDATKGGGWYRLSWPA